MYGRETRMLKSLNFASAFQDIVVCMQASHTHQICIPSVDGMEFLLMVEEKLHKKGKPFSQKPGHSLLLSHLCPRPKGTTLDSTDLSDMPAKPAVPQWPQASPLGWPAWSPVGKSGGWVVVQRSPRPLGGPQERGQWRELKRKGGEPD